MANDIFATSKIIFFSKLIKELQKFILFKRIAGATAKFIQVQAATTNTAITA